MSQILKKGVKTPGAHSIANFENTNMEFLKFDMFNLEAGDEQAWKADGVESVLVLLQGEVEMSGGGLSVRSNRKSVFEDPPTVLYLPPGAEATVKGISKAQVAVCSCVATGQKEAFVIKPDEIEYFTRGTGNFSRKICMIIDPDRDVNHLTCGETFNDAGNWSSYPPHRHEIDRPPVETDLEEIYFFKMLPEQGFGFIRVYTEDHRIDETMTVESEDVTAIKEGFHPLVAGGGYQLYYLWFLGGDKRELVAFDDPVHEWVKKL